MSANNILRIFTDGDTYKAYDMSVEDTRDDPCEFCTERHESAPKPEFEVHVREGEAEAIRKAQEYCGENLVEYGYWFENL